MAETKTENVNVNSTDSKPQDAAMMRPVEFFGTNLLKGFLDARASVHYDHCDRVVRCISALLGLKCIAYEATGTDGCVRLGFGRNENVLIFECTVDVHCPRKLPTAPEVWPTGHTLEFGTLSIVHRGLGLFHPRLDMQGLESHIKEAMKANNAKPMQTPKT